MSDESLIQEFIEGLNDGDEAAIREVLADEIDVIEEEDASYPQDRIVEEFMSVDDALSEVEYTISRIWDESDGVYAAYVQMTGVFDEEYRFPNPGGEGELSVAPTGESVSGSAVYLFGIEDDEITAIRSHGNTEMMLSMGVFEFSGEKIGESTDAEAESGAEAEE